MSRKIKWERARLSKRAKLSVKDEKEFLSRDISSRWLERREHYEAQLKRGVVLDHRCKRRKPTSVKDDRRRDYRKPTVQHFTGVRTGKPPWED